MRIFVGLLAAVIPALSLGQAVVSSASYGPLPAPMEAKYIVSPDGQRIAIVRSSGSRRLVSIDGVDGEIYDAIEQIGSPNAKQGSSTMLMMANEVIFSLNGKRYAYGASRGPEKFVVVDGKTYPFGRQFIFSNDSSRFAYVAGENNAAKTSVVVDGVAGPPFMWVSELMFSDDGKRFIYKARNETGDFVVVDGKATPVATGINNLKIAPKGTRYGYMTVVDRHHMAVIDGVAQKSAVSDSQSSSWEFQFSPDGKRWGMISMLRGAEGKPAYRAVIDGKPGAPYFEIRELTFSPDGKRYGYVASVGIDRNSRRHVLIIDGKQTTLEYRDISKLVFSPDSRRYAAVGTTDAGSFVLVDGKESSAFLGPPKDFKFSNSGRYVFQGRAAVNTGERLYIDGELREDIVPTEKADLTFSPDGKRLIFGGYIKNNRGIYLDGQIVTHELGRWGVGTANEAIFSPDSRHVAYVGRESIHAKEHNMFLNGDPGAAGLQYFQPTFSADGKHFAVAAWVPKHGNKYSIYVNGKPVVEVDGVLDEPGTFQFGSDGKFYAIAKKDKQFQRFVIDPQDSTLAAFASSMPQYGKGGKSGSSSAKNKKTPALPGQTTASNNSSNPADQQMTELEKQQAEAQQKLDEMNEKAKKAADKKKDKLKKVIDIFN